MRHAPYQRHLPVELHLACRARPALRCWPHVRFDLDLVKKWLKAKGITDWPKQTIHDLGVTSRMLWKAVYGR